MWRRSSLASLADAVCYGIQIFEHVRAYHCIFSPHPLYCFSSFPDRVDDAELHAHRNGVPATL